MYEVRELVGDEATVATLNQANNGLGYSRNGDAPFDGGSAAAHEEATQEEVRVTIDSADHTVER